MADNALEVKKEDIWNEIRSHPSDINFFALTLSGRNLRVRMDRYSFKVRVIAPPVASRLT